MFPDQKRPLFVQKRDTQHKTMKLQNTKYFFFFLILETLGEKIKDYIQRIRAQSGIKVLNSYITG